MNEKILAIDGLWKFYQGKAALKGLTMEVTKGQIVGLLGPNGSGKTTTLSIILGATHASKGSFTWLGQNNSRKPIIGSILERPTFANWLSAKDNLHLFGSIKGVSDIAKEIPRVLDRVGLLHERHKKYQYFSLGMKQRLALALAMLGRPEVYVLDEPTNGVDPEGIAAIRKIILELASEGKTILLASHILDEVEKVCSHVAIMREGELLSFSALDAVGDITDAIDVGAEDMQALEASLKTCPLVKSFEAHKGCYRVRVQGQTSAKDLNQYLFNQKVVVNHLIRYHGDLESYFLSTLGHNR